jgi:hypothetical protein
MRLRSVLSLSAFGLFALGQAWCGQDAPSADAQNAIMMETAMATPVANADSSRVAAARLDPVAAAYREHAPLALFSLGSLAVGGVFYAIGRGLDHPNVAYTAGDRTQLTTAVTVAGVSAVLAAGSYFYYVHRAQVRAEEESGWDAEVGAAPDGRGGITAAARLTLPLPSPF